MKIGMIICEECQNNTFIITFIREGVSSQCVNCKHDGIIVDLPPQAYDDFVSSQKKIEIN